jgi:hypothetical protein
MGHPSYPWKRFWCHRSSEFRLTDGGYLSDPDEEYGHILNPDAVSFEQICSIPCLVLLGEPGIGKSTAIQESEATLEVDLGSFQTDTTLANAVFKHPQIQAWAAETQKLTLG